MKEVSRGISRADLYMNFQALHQKKF